MPALTSLKKGVIVMERKSKFEVFYSTTEDIETQRYAEYHCMSAERFAGAFETAGNWNTIMRKLYKLCREFIRNNPDIDIHSFDVYVDDGWDVCFGEFVYLCTWVRYPKRTPNYDPYDWETGWTHVIR